jgi:DNA polymerase-3 subunit gamma/tau
VTFEQPALRLLAQGAHGSMRDALSLTDQAIAYAAGAVTLEAVQGMLGALDQSYLVRLLDALAAANGADLLAVADEMASRSLSYNGALQDLGTLLHRIALAQSVPNAVPQDLPELADILRLAEAFDPQEVQLFYQIAVHGRNEIGLAPDEYAGFTMTLLRMLAFRPGQGGAERLAAPAAAAPRGAAPAVRASPAAAAASAASASQASSAPVRPAPPPPASAPAPAPAPAAAPAPAVNSARAAINAALEAARAASGQRSPPKRPGADAPAAAPASAPAAAPASARPINVGPSGAPPAATGARMAPPTSAVGQPTGAAPPWDQPGAQAQARGQAATADDEPPSWATDFSDDTAVANEAAVVAAPVHTQPAARAPAAPPHAYVITPVPGLDWDGNWPALAATLPLRGVSQQLALQTELIDCHADAEVSANSAIFRLRVPVDTLRASGNSEKLQAALQEIFAGKRITVETEIGPVWYTASAEAKAAKEERQRLAEAIVAGDPFVQEMERTLGAFVVPGSVRPPV